MDDEQPGGQLGGISEESQPASARERLESLRMEAGEPPPTDDPLAEAYEEAKERGEKTDYPPLEEPKPDESDESEKPPEPIDIGEDRGPSFSDIGQRFPKLKPLIESLNAIEKEEFIDKYEQRQSQIGYDKDIDWDRILTLKHWQNWMKSFLPFTDNVQWQKISNPEVYIVQHIAKLTKEFLFFKAICENWDANTLKEQYRLKMRQLWDECAQDSSWYKGIWDSGSTMWLSLWTFDPKSLPGDNPSLKANLESKRIPITLKEGIPRITERLKRVEEQFKSNEATGLIWKDPGYCTQWASGSNECETWNKAEDFDEGILDFIHGRGMQFLREYTIYQGIINGEYLSDFDKSYRDKLAKLYKSALKE